MTPQAVPIRRRWRLAGHKTGQPEGGAYRPAQPASCERSEGTGVVWGLVRSPVQAAACRGSRRKSEAICKRSERAERSSGGNAPAPDRERAGKCVTTLPIGRGRAAGPAVEQREWVLGLGPVGSICPDADVTKLMAQN